MKLALLLFGTLVLTSPLQQGSLTTSGPHQPLPDYPHDSGYAQGSFTQEVSPSLDADVQRRDVLTPEGAMFFDVKEWQVRSERHVCAVDVLIMRVGLRKLEPGRQGTGCSSMGHGSSVN